MKIQKGNEGPANSRSALQESLICLAVLLESCMGTKWMFLAFSHHRCVCVWPVCDRHFCERRAGGDGQPGTVLPHRLPAQLYRHWVPSQPPVYFQRQHLHGEPGGSGASQEILPIQRRLTQRLLSRLCHRKSLAFLPSSIYRISDTYSIFSNLI